MEIMNDHDLLRSLLQFGSFQKLTRSILQYGKELYTVYSHGSCIGVICRAGKGVDNFEIQDRAI
jgi:predicted transcriptional regulator with HTH domain